MNSKRSCCTHDETLDGTNAKFDAKFDTSSLDATNSYEPMSRKYIYLSIARILNTW